MGKTGKCFVIQPFDKDRYDKRYDDVLAPAIEEAGLQPYRVDRDPSVSIPIEDIEDGIRSSRVCLADITTDNPNVWFELGYAIASRKEVVLVCSVERQRFPFDVQHRSIIQYRTDSSSDFVKLRGHITERLKAVLQKRESLEQVASIEPTTKIGELRAHEIAALVSIAKSAYIPGNGVTPNALQEDMANAGSNEIATTLAVRSLLKKELIETSDVWVSNDEAYTIYRVTDAGIEWLTQNQEFIDTRSQAPMQTPGFVSIPLEPEQKELLSQLVEAVSSIPRDKRKRFSVVRSQRGGTCVKNRALPDLEIEVLMDDVNWLDRVELISLSLPDPRGAPYFNVTARGFEYYTWMKQSAGPSIQGAETEIKSS
jgi:nucleoside 2-deoxyribosyltransferase